MAKRKSQTINLKNIAFRNRGPKLTRAKVDSLPVSLPEEYVNFLLVHNGGTPVNNAFRYPFKGMENISTLDYFYAVRPRSNHVPYDNLIYHGILGHRNDLPRWSIPIARADDDSFVLIFEAGPYEGSVWYFIWLHDDPDSDPYVNCRGAMEKIADSIPEFLATLRPYYDFYSIVSFIVPSNIKLSSIKRATKPLGLNWVQYDDSHGTYACFDWRLLENKTFLDTNLFLVNNDRIPSTHYAGLKLPKIEAPKQSRVLHLVVSDTFRNVALKKLPKKIEDWKLVPANS